jgi:hypothetical protein
LTKSRARLLVSALLATTTAHATNPGDLNTYRDAYRDIRWLGRGNTGVAIVDDASSLFYNPAGIGAIKSIKINIANPYAAANQNFYTSFKQILTLTSGSQTLSEKFGPLAGKPLAMQGGFMPSLQTPSFVIGFYDYADAALEYRDPVYPHLRVEARNDWGIVLGTGFSYQDMIFWGASLRYVRRRSIIESITAGSLIQNAATIMNDVSRYGETFAINTGVQLRQVFGRHTLSAGLAIEDLGFSKWRNAQRTLLPPSQAQQINIGGAYAFNSGLVDTKVLFDVRGLKNPGSFTKKIYTGIESSFFGVDVRAGLFQGYWTAGLSLRMIPFVDIDLATYGEELDAIAGQRVNRFYMIGLRTGLELMTTGKSASGGSGKRRQRFRLDRY